MKAKFKRRVLLSGSILAALLILIVAGLLIMPMVVDHEAIQTRILTEISDQTNGRISFQKVTLSIFPRPHARVSDGRIDLPGAGLGRIRSLSIYPKILPLLLGKVQVGRVVLRTPEVSLNLADTSLPDSSEGQSRLPGRARMEERLREFVSILLDKAPGFELSIKRGGVRATGRGEVLFRAYAINVDFSVSDDRIEFRGKARADMWEELTVHGAIEPDTLKSNGRFTVVGFRPRPLYAFFLPSPRYTLGDSTFNFDASFTAEGTRNIQTTIEALSPAIPLTRGSEKVLLKGVKLQTAIEKSESGWRAEISSMRAEAPRFHLTGELSHNPSLGKADLRLEASDTDAATVREAALALGGDYKVVDRIFEIVRAGEVPRITYHASATDLGHLGRPENFILKGFLTGGTILAPKAELMVEEATGEVTVVNGILEGSKLAGRSGKSVGSNGFLRIDLRHGDGPFHFDLDLDADLSELPPILHRVVKNERFLNEISLLSQVRGHARGRLTLGETRRDVNVRVDVDAFTLSAAYERIPHPVKINGDLFLLDGPSLSLKGVSGTVGTSSFSGASALIAWGSEPRIEVKAVGPTALDVVIEEVHPWVITYEWVRNVIKDFEPTRGRLNLDSFALDGPLFERKKWAFQAGGTLMDLAVQSATFPAPITVKSGRFRASREEITITDSLAAFADASLTVSGTLKDYLQGAAASTLDFEGTVGPKGFKTIAGWVRIPEAFRVNSTFSVSEAHVQHHKGATAFKGSLSVAKGPRLELDLAGSSDELNIRRLSVKDDVSDATLTYLGKGRDFNFSFKGALKAQTIRGLLVRNDWLTGSVQGNFSAAILTGKPGESTAKGSASIHGLILPVNPGETISIESAAVKAESRNITAESAMLHWRGNRFQGSGRIGFSPDGFLLNADVSTPALNWDAIQKTGEGSAPEGEGHGGAGQKEQNGFLQNPRFRGAPVRGSLRVQTDRFTIGDNSWEPFQARMSFKKSGTDVELSKAVMCQVATPGLIRITPSGTTMIIDPAARNIPVDSFLACLFGKKDLMDGSLDIEGTLAAIPNADWIKTLNGVLDFNATDGRIFRFGLMYKIFSVLNVTEIFRGELPDLIGEGCPYKTIRAKGMIQDGRLEFSEGVLDSSCMKVVWQGYVDLPTKKVEATVMISPLRTVDTIVGHIPLLGDWLGGALISIPVKVSGDLSDPQVFPMAPSAVGAEFLNFMKRTFQLPFKMLQPSK